MRHIPKIDAPDLISSMMFSDAFLDRNSRTSLFYLTYSYSLTLVHFGLPCGFAISVEKLFFRLPYLWIDCVRWALNLKWRKGMSEEKHNVWLTLETKGREWVKERCFSHCALGLNRRWRRWSTKRKGRMREKEIRVFRSFEWKYIIKFNLFF